MTIPNNISATDILHKVRHRVASFLLQRPMHPTAWYVYAWALSSEAKFDQSSRAFRQCLRVIDLIRGQMSPDDATNMAEFQNFAEAAREGLQRCEAMSTILNGGKLTNPTTVGDDAPNILVPPSRATSCTLDTLLTCLNSIDLGKFSTAALRSMLIEAFTLKIAENDDGSALNYLLRMFEQGAPEEKSKICDTFAAISADVLSQEAQPTPEKLRVYLHLLLIARDRCSIGRATDFSKMKIWYPNSVLVLSNYSERFEQALQTISRELKASRLDDDHLRKSSFFDDNAGDERMPVLYSLAAANFFISRLFSGLPASCDDVNLALRGIAMAPYMNYPWSVYWQGSFADAVLGSRLSISNLIDLPKDYFESVSLHGIHQIMQVYRMLGAGKDGVSQSFNKKLLDLLGDGPKYLRWAVLRTQADVYVAATRVTAANECYQIAVEEAMSSAIDPITVLSLELQALFATLQQYQQSNNYELLSQARSKLEESAKSFPLVAAVHVLRALVWTLLKKAAKASEALMEAKALWDAVEPMTSALEP